MEELGGGWQILNPRPSHWDEFDFIDFSLKCKERKYPTKQLMDVNVLVDSNESTKTYSIVSGNEVKSFQVHRKNANIVVPSLMHTLQVIDRPSTMLGNLLNFREFMGEKNIYKAYHQMIVDLAVMYGADRSNAEVKMYKSLIFESKILKVMDIT